jgi:hypothetical protein
MGFPSGGEEFVLADGRLERRRLGMRLIETLSDPLG